MKILSAVFIILGSFAALSFATGSRVKMDGSVEFAMGKYGSQLLWTAQEIQDVQTALAIFSATSPVSVTLLTPADYEVNLSTCLIVSIDGKNAVYFESYSDWILCQTKVGLKKKVRRIRALLDSMSDLPASDSKDLKERYGWIKSYYLSLP